MKKTFRSNEKIKSIFSLFATKFKNLNYSHFINLHLTRWKNVPKFKYFKIVTNVLYSFYSRKLRFFWEISFDLSAHVENIACLSQRYYARSPSLRNRLQFLVTGFLNSLVFSVVFHTIKRVPSIHFLIIYIKCNKIKL